ncbi:MFS transporter [Clavibacter sp. VKM Ac-2872]|uniref:MFS transporter n=1 Tax=Clavibacter sp. VKM Ac-2872 TaxID=2783812 RepID=UPI00188C3E8F|nr:MFS transporter [Clavibacter sp. VKM Ac-2872]MBF4625460.1 hypothetical protein [Clavibacter sp. VKM Ac-2872]
MAIALNAAYIGQTSVAIPTAFASEATPTTTIVTFNITVVLTAIIANAVILARRHQIGTAKVALLVGSGSASLGAALLTFPVPPLLAAPLIGASSVVFSLSVSSLPRADPRASGRARQVFIVGYLAGLGSAGALSSAGVTASGILIIAAMAQASSFAASSASGRGGAEAVAQTRRVRPAGTREVPAAGLVAAFGSIFFMRAADSIRANYLPLHLLHGGHPPWLSAVLLMTASVIEISLLPLLASSARRMGVVPILVLVNCCGAASFLSIALGDDDVIVLVGSQILYAAFGAGYQSLGLTFLQRLLPETSTGGTSLYTVAVQCGAMLGIVTALSRPDFDSSLFVFAVVFLASAIACLVSMSIASKRRDPEESGASQRSGSPP